MSFFSRVFFISFSYPYFLFLRVGYSYFFIWLILFSLFTCLLPVSYSCLVVMLFAKFVGRRWCV